MLIQKALILITSSHPSANDSKMDAIRQSLEASTDEELEDQLSLRISFKEDCPPQRRRNHSLSQALAREILESRRAATAIQGQHQQR